jgi:SPP1 family predicted phage head-tail adaptor
MPNFDIDLQQFDPGKYRHVAELQENLGVDNYGTYGERTDNWQAISGSSEIRCSIVTLTGLELIRARQLTNEVTHRIECNYRRGVNTKQRLRWIDSEESTHLLHIRHKNNPEQMNLNLVLLCVEEPNST